MMDDLLQNPGFDFPFSCCKLKDGSDFTTKSPKQEDVANWTQCKDEFENLKIPEKYSQLHKIVSVFLTFVSPGQPQQYCQ